EVASLDLGTFDYIIAGLHQLDSPEEGMAALVNVLVPDGAIGAMVHGQYGRTAICQLQALLRLLAPASLAPENRLRRAKAVLANLRPDHWAAFGRNTWQTEMQQN